MSQNQLVNVLIAAVIFFLPLSGAPPRLLHPAPWIGFVCAAVILGSQPPLGPKTMVSDVGDRISGLAIFTGMIGSMLVGIVDFGYRPYLFPHPVSGQVVGGAALALGALALRLWSIHTLGRFFTSTVQVQEGQTVVASGPYRILRHPSYTGALLTSVGVTVTLGSLWGLGMVLSLALPAYVYRVRVEEEALVKGLGEPYRVYKQRTWRLLPLVY